MPDPRPTPRPPWSLDGDDVRWGTPIEAEGLRPVTACEARLDPSSCGAILARWGPLCGLPGSGLTETPDKALQVALGSTTASWQIDAWHRRADEVLCQLIPSPRRRAWPLPNLNINLSLSEALAAVALRSTCVLLKGVGPDVQPDRRY